jgi:tRNA-dihydrouridine synthase A
MEEPELVAECVDSMLQSVSIPVTVKCRIGIDDQDSEAALQNFIGIVADAGCDLFIVHARKAILSGLSPKQNRDIPPLDYDRVYRLKSSFENLSIIINGGIIDMKSALDHLNYVDGVMLGREAYQNPFILAEVDERFFGAQKNELTRSRALTNYLPYVEQQVAAGVPLQHITRHLLGLFKGVYGGKAFRRHLSQNAYKPTSGIEVLEEAMYLVDKHAQNGEPTKEETKDLC